MKVYVENQEFTLEEQNSISGGEGTVYIQNNMAFKIYHKQSNMIPTGKFKELTAIKNTNVIKPEKLIFNKNNEPIGYTMKPVYNTCQLSRIITTDYQKSNGITPEQIVSIIEKTKEIISSIHKDNCLIVDINDSNILVDKDLNVFFIDVDSYKTKNYPATALQDYAKDHQVINNNFSELSDWFSFGLLSVKLLLGIHPYMGRWKLYKNKDIENTLSYRAKKNISIFNKEVVYPKTVRNFSLIPQNYYTWFLDIFEKGLRLEPPSQLGKFYISAEKLILSSQKKVVFTKKETINENINFIYNGFRSSVISYLNGTYFNNEYTSLTAGKKTILFNQKDEPLIFKVNNFKIESFNLITKEKRVYPQIEAEELFVFNNNLYAKLEDNFLNLELLNYGIETLTVKQNYTIMPYACSFFYNTFFQNTLGKSFFYLVHDKDTMPVVKIPELDGKNIINAKYEKNILIVSYQEGHSYITIGFKFNNLFTEYNVFYQENNESSGVNFTVNDQGVIVFIPNEGELIVLFNAFNNQHKRVIEDDNIHSNMSLYSIDNTIKMYVNNSVYNISLN